MLIPSADWVFLLKKTQKTFSGYQVPLINHKKWSKGINHYRNEKKKKNRTNCKSISKLLRISFCTYISRHIILVTTEIIVIISNKNHPALISLLLFRVAASVPPSPRCQDDLDLLLCLHLNTSWLRSFNSSLRSLKLIILIFSLVHKLHLSLKLFTVEDCLTIFHFIWGGVGSP